jgi:hypothetical protein
MGHDYGGRDAMNGSLRERLGIGCCALMLAGAAIAGPLVESASAQGARPQPTVNTAAPASITSSDDLVQWMTYYYLHPQPDLLVPALLFADTSGMIDKGQAPLTAFVSRVFVQNPSRIAGWTEQLKALSSRSKPMLWSALWWSNTLEGKQSLEQLLTTLNEKQATVVLSQMAHPAQPMETMDIKTPEVLDELWGAFSATGDEKYVDRLITVLPWQYSANGDYMRMTIGSAARWSLTSNAQQHPAVMKACIRARDTQPQLKGIMEKIIADANKAAPTQTGQSGPAL